MSVRFSTSVEELVDINPSFAKAKMHIAYAGKNVNRSEISQEVFEEAIPTIFNCPIVARYSRETDSFGSHDIEVVVKKDELKIVNATTPIGVVPVGADVFWEDVDGVNYLTVSPVILWKRQEAYQHLEDVGNVDISFEGAFEKYHYKHGFMVADKICFGAFCLLESASPCFEGADIELFSANNKEEFEAEFHSMLNELKETVITSKFDIKQGFDIDESSEKGGKDLKLTNERRDEILTSYSLTIDDIDFEITDDETEESFNEKLDAYFGRRGVAGSDEETQTHSDDGGDDGESGGDEAGDDNEGDPEPEDAEPETKENFSATYEQKRTAIENAVNIQNSSNEDEGTAVSFWLMDFDDNFAYVAHYVYTDNCCDCVRDQGRFAYRWNEDSRSAEITSIFEPMIIQWLTVEENNKLEESRAVFEELVKFHDERIAQDYRNSVDEVLAEFEDLENVDEFVTFKEGVYEIADLDTIRDKCFAIRGRQIKVSFNKKPEKNQTKVAIGEPEHKADKVPVVEYSNLFAQFAEK